MQSLFPRKKVISHPGVFLGLVQAGNHGRLSWPDTALSTVSGNHSQILTWLALEAAV